MGYDQNNLNRRFDRESELWRDLYRSPEMSAFKYNNKLYRQRYVLEMLGEGSGPALDLGCGTGSFLPFLKSLGYQAVGMDYAQKMVEIAKSDNQDKIVLRGDALNLPFSEGVFKRAIAVGLIEYLPDDGQFLSGLKRILAPGAKVVITFRNSRCLERKLMNFWRRIGVAKKIDYYCREHETKKFKKLLLDMGFRDINIRYCHFYPLTWPFNLLISPLNAYLSNKMESVFSSGNIDFLASTFIISFRNGDARPGNEYSSERELKIEDIISCPASGARLSLAPGNILQKVNESIQKRSLKNNSGKIIEETLEGAFVSDDGKMAFPIIKGSPILLTEEGFRL